MRLSTILSSKGRLVLSVTPDTLIANVIKLLAEKRIGAVLVTDSSGHLEGILSERDIVRCLAVRMEAVFEMTALEVMTRSPKTATSDTTVAQAMEMMTLGRFRHLPVEENGKLVGMVSIGDVVKARSSQQELEVDSLRSYVSGGVN